MSFNKILAILKTKSLILANLKKDKLSPHIPKLVNLEELTISEYQEHTKISELPIDIGDLINLKKFSIIKNELKEIPESFGALKNLEKATFCDKY